MLCRGLWTDIVIGPYLSFGVRSDSRHKFAQQLFEIHNKGTGVEQNRHVRCCTVLSRRNFKVAASCSLLGTLTTCGGTQNTTEVAVFNVLSYLYELEKGEPYVMKKAHDVYSGIGESELDQGSETKQPEACPKIVEVEDDESSNQRAERCECDQQVQLVAFSDANAHPTRDQLKMSAKEHDARQRAQTIFETFEGVKIIPLTGDLEDMYAKKRYSRKFDHVFLSTQHNHTLLKTPDADEARRLTDILADNAAVSIESPVCVVSSGNDLQHCFVDDTCSN